MKKFEILEKLELVVPETNLPRIVIIGGGFAGIKLARGLRKSKYQIVMFDRNNYHNFQPLLYQVATAGLEPDSIAGPLRQLFEKQKNFYFRMARVTKINPDKNTISTMIGDLRYDYLVIANGSRTNFFNNESFTINSFPLKQIPHALDLRSQLLQNFEKAVLTPDEKMVESLMNIVVVGGGPTGVEVSGALGELRGHVLPKDFPELDFHKMNIYLVEGNKRLLSGMSEKSAEKALKYLEKFNIKVYLNTVVKEFKDNTVYLSDGKEIPSQTLIWGAGVRGNLIDGLPEKTLENDRIIVDAYHKVINTDNIYAIGDIAIMKSEELPKGHPMLAPVALQQGTNLSLNFKKLSQNKPLRPFKYLDKGSMATIGRNKAVVDLPGNVHFGGFFAWLVWMFIHLLSIIGFRNKIIVFSNWLWNYITYDRGTRLIIRLFLPDHKPKEKYGSY